jgi:hypothetical protein
MQDAVARIAASDFISDLQHVSGGTPGQGDPTPSEGDEVCDRCDDNLIPDIALRDLCADVLISHLTSFCVRTHVALATSCLAATHSSLLCECPQSACMHAHTHTHTHTHTHARTHTHTHTHTHAHARTHANSHTLTHERTHARTHARIHTHTHTHTHARARNVTNYRWQQRGRAQGVLDVDRCL